MTKAKSPLNSLKKAISWYITSARWRIREAALERAATSRKTAGVSTDPLANGKNLVVSLTSIPSRVSKLHLVIETLFRQSLKPSRVVLWLSRRDFENLDKLPRKLLAQTEHGLEIQFRNRSWPHMKLIPSLQNWPDDLIVTTDDDNLLEPDWLKSLFDAYLAEPQFIHCHRARLMTYDDLGQLLPYNSWPVQSEQLCNPSHRVLATGVGGILYFPGCLDAEVFNVNMAERLCPKADDLWFKIMAVLGNTRCKALKPSWKEPHQVLGSQRISLMASNVAESKNDVQMNELICHYELSEADFHSPNSTQ